MRHRMNCPLIATATIALLLWTTFAHAAEPQEVMKFARFQTGDTVAYGLVEGDQIRQLDGDLFGEWHRTDRVYGLSDVKLLVPTRPSKVLALAGNYKSHLSTTPAHDHPALFLKSPSCLIADGEEVVIPEGATDVHHEAELVIVIGRRAKNVSVDQARDYVFGVTCGNDISERIWQKNDVQWVRAKASDTFGPCGPYIVRGIDYDDLLLQLRVNGQVRQEQRTSELVHGVAEIVSWASRFMTLEPGDLIFTGTPGTTSPIKPNDVMEVDLEGVGVLTNRVAARSASAGLSASSEQTGSDRFFELRIYTTHPGKLGALHARFRNHTNRLFEKHGMQLIGYWTPADGEDANNTLVYVLAYPSRDARDKAWKAFRDDPEWKKAKEESQRDGPIVKKVESKFMHPTDYSPIQ